MKHAKYFLLLSLLIGMSSTGFAQKQVFDVVSFDPPKGWQELKNEGGIQLSITDKKTGAYAVAIITKPKTSASVNENFNTDWNKLVKAAVMVSAAPTLSDMGVETGWNCITGQANYTDGATKGIATLITATGYDQTASVVIMTNTSKYQEEILAFVNSLKLAKPTQNEVSNVTPATAKQVGKSSVVGLWCDNHLETNGYFNGFPQYTAGYCKREYLFKADGTYNQDGFSYARNATGKSIIDNPPRFKLY